ncbi:MAG: hypothetical protein ACK529_08225, partial [Alphaproteobacteria bacterium]
ELHRPRLWQGRVVGAPLFGYQRSKEASVQGSIMKKWSKKLLIAIVLGYLLYPIAIFALFAPPGLIMGVHDKETLQPLQRMRMLGLFRIIIPERIDKYHPLGILAERYVAGLQSRILSEMSSPNSRLIAQFYYQLPDIANKKLSFAELSHLREAVKALPASNDPYEVIFEFDVFAFLTGRLHLGYVKSESDTDFSRYWVSYADDFSKYYSPSNIRSRASMLGKVYATDTKASLFSELYEFKVRPLVYIWARDKGYLSSSEFRQHTQKLERICSDIKAYYPMPQAKEVVDECFAKVKEMKSFEGE